MNEKTDILIIGAGIAGLSAGIYASRSGMKTIILDDSGGGGQALEIASLENYPGIFPAVHGYELAEKLVAQAKSFGAEIRQTSAVSLEFVSSKNVNENEAENSAFSCSSPDFRSDFRFIVKTRSSKDSFIEAKALIYATGAEHAKLNVQGEKEFEGKGVSYCAVCDGPFFRGKNVVVVGGGDSACSEALYLSGIAAHIDLVHRRNEFRAAKTLSERILSSENISVHFETKIKEIKGNTNVQSVEIENVKSGGTENIPADAVFVCVGMNPKNQILENLAEKLEKDKNGYFTTDEKMATKIPGLFIAGDVRSKPLRQIVTAANDGAIAAFSAAEFVKSLEKLTCGGSVLQSKTDMKN